MQNILKKQENLNNFFLTFTIKQDNEIFRGISSLQNTYVVTNTTNPWVLDFDSMLAIVEDMEYSIVEVKQKAKSDYYIIASEYVEYVMETAFFIRFNVRKKVLGKELIGVVCNNILDNAKDLKVISAKKEHVILDSKKSSGISIVSTGNTSIDFLISKYNNSISIKNNLDKEGKAIQSYNFNNVYYKQINDKVLEDITNKGKILCSDNVKVEVCKCSNCDEEIIYRNEEVWCIRKNENEELLKQLFDNIISKINTDNAKKEDIKKRLYSSIIKKERIISDEDIFGIPVPIVYCSECSNEVINDTSIEILKQLFKTEGLRAWYNKSPNEIFDGKVTCDNCGNSTFFKRNSYINEFFKSICIDLLNEKNLNDNNISKINICIENEREFIKKIKDVSFDDGYLIRLKNINKILLHPEIKSKSDKNKLKDKEIKIQEDSLENIEAKPDYIFDFDSVIKKYGVDILRLWCIQNSKQKTAIIDEFKIVSSVKVYRKLRNTIKFLLSNLYDFNPSKNMVNINDRDDLDKYMYIKLLEMKKLVDKKYNELDLNNVVIDVLKFCEEILSAKYFQVSKYRLYVLDSNDIKRRSTQSTFYEIFMTLLNLLEPILPFTFEEAWSYIWHINSEEESNLLLHRNELEQVDIQKFEQSIKKWNNIFFIIKRVNIQVNKAVNKKKIKNSLQARVILSVNEKTKEFIDSNHEDFLRALNVSVLKTELSEKSSILIETADGIECKMCKNYSVDIGKDINYRHLCPVCSKIMSKRDMNKRV
jgi:isoleucyl-tRNA synthetase